jgi:histidinol-phosphate/aromatic aminotransferase/cobyric acid decarboxylase-like protein
VREFREACVAKGVRVARDFPPFESSHCRISFGTMEEMQKAVAVFGEVLGKAAASAAA